MKYTFYGETKSGRIVNKEITKEAYHNIRGWINSDYKYIELMFPNRPNKITLFPVEAFEFYSVDADDS